MKDRSEERRRRGRREIWERGVGEKEECTGRAHEGLRRRELREREMSDDVGEERRGRRRWRYLFRQTKVLTRL